MIYYRDYQALVPDPRGVDPDPTFNKKPDPVLEPTIENKTGYDPPKTPESDGMRNPCLHASFSTINTNTSFGFTVIKTLFFGYKR